MKIEFRKRTVKPTLAILALVGGLWTFPASLRAANNSDADSTLPTNIEAASTADFTPGKGLQMNFRGVPLETVLNYLSKAAGFIIRLGNGVNVQGKVDVWSEQPMSKEEAVQLLKQVLNENGYAVVQNERMLTVIQYAQAKSNDGTPVEMIKDFKTVPKNTDVVTAIIPLRTLNPADLLRNLQPLLPNDTTVTANESANALMMTDTHAKIRHVAEIITMLDSVTASVNTIRVFPLTYADAKTTVGLIKDLFPSQDASSRNGGNNIGTRFGSGGGFPGPGGGFPPGPGGFPGDMGGNDNAGSSGNTPGSRVSAVAEDHSNSIIISAPENLMAIIEQVIQEIDVNVQAVTEIKVFRLKHADPTEMADLLSNLYSDSNRTTESSRVQGQTGGGPGFPFANATPTASSSAGKSERAKQLGQVTAVADARTSRLVVTAASALMPQIIVIIKELDEDPARIVRPHVVSLANANPYDVYQILQDLIPAGANAKSSTSNPQSNNPLSTRATILQNQMNSSGANTTANSFGSTPGSSSGGGSR